MGEDTKGDKNPPPYLDPHYGAKTEQNSVQRDEEQKERQVMTYPSVTRAAKNDLWLDTESKWLLKKIIDCQ